MPILPIDPYHSQSSFRYRFSDFVSIFPLRESPQVFFKGIELEKILERDLFPNPFEHNTTHSHHIGHDAPQPLPVPSSQYPNAELLRIDEETRQRFADATQFFLEEHFRHIELELRQEGSDHDALMDFWDHEFGTKGVIFESTVEEAMLPKFLDAFGVLGLQRVESVDPKRSWSEISHEYDLIVDYVHTNIIELILINERLSGRLKHPFYKIYIERLPADRHIVLINLRINYLDHTVSNYGIHYGMKTGIVMVKETSHSKVDKLRYYYTPKPAHVGRILGTLSRLPIQLVIDYQSQKSDYERAMIGNWTSDKLMHHHHQEGGHWIHKVTGKTLGFHSRYRVFRNAYGLVMVIKSIRIDNTLIQMAQFFRPHIPIPFLGSGYILLNL